MNTIADVRKMGVPVPREEVGRQARAKVGAFHPEVRVRCPLVDFALIPCARCLECYYFGGVRNRVIIGEVHNQEPRGAARTYMIECTHPITRALIYVPQAGGE